MADSLKMSDEVSIIVRTGEDDDRHWKWPLRRLLDSMDARRVKIPFEEDEDLSGDWYLVQVSGNVHPGPVVLEIRRTPER